MWLGKGKSPGFSDGQMWIKSAVRIVVQVTPGEKQHKTESRYPAKTEYISQRPHASTSAKSTTVQRSSNDRNKRSHHNVYTRRQ